MRGGGGRLHLQSAVLSLSPGEMSAGEEEDQESEPRDRL